MTGEQSWLDEYAQPCFNTAQQDPYYEGDTSQYHKSKELANSVSAGTVFPHFAHGGAPLGPPGPQRPQASLTLEAGGTPTRPKAGTDGK